MSKYASKKWILICAGWVLLIAVLLRGAFHGFPDSQASMAWDYLKIGYTPFLLVLTGWFMKKDIDEKKVLNGKN